MIRLHKNKRGIPTESSNSTCQTRVARIRELAYCKCLRHAQKKKKSANLALNTPRFKEVIRRNPSLHRKKTHKCKSVCNRGPKIHFISALINGATRRQVNVLRVDFVGADWKENAAETRQRPKGTRSCRLGSALTSDGGCAALQNTQHSPPVCLLVYG